MLRLGLGEEHLFSFFFLPLVHLLFLNFLLNHKLGTLLNLLKDVLLNRTNPCFVVVFLQNLQHQQQGLYNVLTIASL